VVATNEDSEELEPREKYWGWSLAKVQRGITEAMRRITENWSKMKHNIKKTVYKMNRKRGMHGLLGQAKMMIAESYFQLKVGHALTGVYLERIKGKESGKY
jgi:hypothetical protein